MVMSSGKGITFMYRAGGIAVHEERLLVEKNLEHGFCFAPGGRVEFGENAVDALAREIKEELGEEVTVGRLVVVRGQPVRVGWRQISGDRSVLHDRVRPRG